MTTVLQAITISSALTGVCAPGYTGQVHSVFQRVLNLLGDGQLLTIADAAIGDLPNGIQVRLPVGCGFVDAGLAPGGAVVGAGLQLTIDESIVAIDLSHARVVTAHKNIDVPFLPLSDRLANLRTAQAQGLASASGSGLGPLWRVLDSVVSANLSTVSAGSTSLLCEVAAGPLCELAAGVRAGDPSRVGAAAERLVGLGCGLTPSGDDVLTGLSASLALIGDLLPPAQSIKPLLDAIAAAAEGRTNIIAWTYLRHAVKGETTGVLSSYVSALVTGSAVDVEKASRELFAVGSTSGTELALGAILGARLLAT